MRKILNTAIVETLSIILLWGCLTDGWKPAPMKAWARAILILAIICTAEFNICVILGHEVYVLRLTGNKEYVGFVKKFEDRYFDVIAENVQLQRDLAAEQGKTEINSIYMGKLTAKPTYSGAQLIDKTTGKLTSADGLTREEKCRRAYSLSVDGWSNEEIAEELGLSSGSVRSYISRGKKSYDRRGDPVRDKDNPNVTHFVRPEKKPALDVRQNSDKGSNPSAD